MAFGRRREKRRLKEEEKRAKEEEKIRLQKLRFDTFVTTTEFMKAQIRGSFGIEAANTFDVIPTPFGSPVMVFDPGAISPFKEKEQSIREGMDFGAPPEGLRNFEE